MSACRAWNEKDTKRATVECNKKLKEQSRKVKMKYEHRPGALG